MINCEIKGTSGGVVFLDFFNGGPCLDVHTGRVCVVISIVAPVVSSAVATVAIVVAVRAIASVVIIVTCVALPPWQVLAFLVAALGPALRFVVPSLLAIAALDGVVVSLLPISGKGFFWASLRLALFEYTMIIFVGHQSDYPIWRYIWSCGVSCGVNSIYGGFERGGK